MTFSTFARAIAASGGALTLLPTMHTLALMLSGVPSCAGSRPYEKVPVQVGRLRVERRSETIAPGIRIEVSIMGKYTIVKQLAAWPTLVGMGMGAALVAFVVYPPAPGWGSHEKWGDVATWVSSLATFLAVVAALVVPAKDARERSVREAERRERRAWLLCVDLVQTLIVMRAEICSYRQRLPTMTGMFNPDGAKKLQAMQLTTAERIPGGLLLEDMPRVLAETVAILSMQANGYNDVVRRHAANYFYMEESDPPARVRSLCTMLNQVHEQLVHVADLAATYHPALRDIDLRDRGDGTSIPQPTVAA